MIWAQELRRLGSPYGLVELDILFGAGGAAISIV